MSPFRYPVWFSRLDGRQIDLAWQQAVSTLKHTADSDPDAVAVRAVLQVLEVVAVRVKRHRDRQLVDVLVGARDDLRDQIIAEIDRVRTTIQTTLDGFEQLVDAALEQQSWWSQEQTMHAEPVTRAKTQKRRPTPEQLKVERERIVLPLLEELEWSVSGWATHGGMRPSIALDYLEGKRTQKVNRIRLTNVLAKALHRNIPLLT